MKYFLVGFLFSLFLCFPCEVESAGDKELTLERMKEVVNNPAQAKEMRRKVKNASKKELAELARLNKVAEKQISVMASSLPRKVDQYTTLDSAGISGGNIVFKYTVLNDTPGIENKSELMAEMSNSLKINSCTSPAGVFMIMGYVWSYFYFLEDGSYYGGVIIDAKTCGFE